MTPLEWVALEDALRTATLPAEEARRVLFANAQTGTLIPGPDADQHLQTIIRDWRHGDWKADEYEAAIRTLEHALGHGNTT